MGLFDKLFGSRKKEEKPAEAAHPVAEVAVEELERRLREARSTALRKHEQPFAEKAALISAESNAILPLLDHLSKKKIDENNVNYKIAIQERNAYSARMKPLLSQLSKRPPGEPLTTYAEVLSTTVASMLKTTSDNRYVFIFYAEDMAKIGDHMKRLDELSAQVGEMIAKLRADSSAYDKVLLDCAELTAASADRKKLVSELVHAEVDYGQANKTLEEARAKFPLQEIEACSKELSTAEADVASARQALANALNGFQRALRKYQKICLDKRLAALAAIYAETPVDAVINEFRATSDYKELRELLEELATSIEVGQITADEKERLKLLGEATKVSSGQIKQFLEKTVAASAAAEKAGQKLAELESSRQALAAEEQRVAELRFRSADVERKMKEASDKEASLYPLIEQAASPLLNQKLVIKRG
ncbi:hypothetical protein H0O03_01605 [Candidatus Micrarchaeota archaeon]|nr:hypothetical protein [Candidatus Micrarchaeota archaeon]